LIDRDLYLGLFGKRGAALSDEDWIALANTCLPHNLSPLNARIVIGSRSSQTLQLCHEPNPGAFTFINLSGGSVAEMLDQAAMHCGTFITGHSCPILTMTVNYLRAGAGNLFVATARVLEVTSVSALLAAELVDAKERNIASATVVSQLIKDLSRYERGDDR
jgi:acyl-coenzyme A thioesterase PaaI-like protein